MKVATQFPELSYEYQIKGALQKIGTKNIQQTGSVFWISNLGLTKLCLQPLKMDVLAVGTEVCTIYCMYHKTNTKTLYGDTAAEWLSCAFLLTYAKKRFLTSKSPKRRFLTAKIKFDINVLYLCHAVTIFYVINPELCILGTSNV